MALFDGLRAQGWIEAHDDGGWAVTAAGGEALDAIGLDGASWQRRSQRGGANASRIAYGCIDWSERRDHMAGALAVALLGHFTKRGWLRRREGERSVEVTPDGSRALHAWLPGLESACAQRC